MTIVDSHCHVSPVWYEPVETLLFQMDRNEVAQAVLVQMLGQYDNAYQRDAVRRFPGRFASVVGVDPTQANAVTQLQALADQGARGVRLRPDARSSGSDPLAIWRIAQSRNLVVSCVGTSAAFTAPQFQALLEQVPGLNIVLEHLGGSSRPDTNEDERAARQRVIRELAAFPNVSLKVPGLGELLPRTTTAADSSQSPFTETTPQILRDALSYFGPERLLWGSDFPPVAAREGYANALKWCRRAFKDEPAASQAWIFGATAKRLFDF